MPAADEERRRLSALHRLGVLDSPPEAAFDDLAWLAATVCRKPSAVVSLVDSERQWFKARIGIDVTETPRELAFCSHCILDDQLLYVPDARLDPRFFNHPLVVGEPFIRFYAGAPLIGTDGERYGTVCVFDSEPGALDDSQKESMIRLAHQTVRQLESRRDRLVAKAKSATLSNLIDALPDAIISCDADGRVSMVNRAAREWFGQSQSGLLEDPTAPKLRLFDGDGRVELQRERLPLFRALRGEQIRQEAVVAYVGGQPPLVTICSAEPLRSISGEPVGAVAIVHDVTALRAAHARLAQSEAHLRVMLRSIGDGVIATDLSGRIAFLNHEASRLLQCSEGDALGRPVGSLLRLRSEDGDQPVPDPVTNGVRDKPGMALATGSLLQQDGTRVWIEYRAADIRDEAGVVFGAVIVIRDISQARALAKAIEHQSMHDPLTNLPNRRELEAVLGTLIEAPDGPTAAGAVLFVDLDQFKVVNDTCGHVGGDALLKQAATVMRGALRATDLLSRFGGDEFAVVLRSCRLEDALRIADSVRQSVESTRFSWQGKPFSISASVGVVDIGSASSTSELLSVAASACNLAKEKGRNRVYVHRVDDADLQQHRSEMTWVSRIQSALDGERLVLFGQRIVSLGATASPAVDVDHFEVLLRMRDELGNLVPPMAFIPAAERYGLMNSIDRRVLDQALAALAQCRDADHFPVLSINLSGRTLGDDSFLEYADRAFARHGVPYEQVCFEVTETTAIANLEHAEKFISWFRQRGSQFSLDDFGSGMSSFGYLKRLRVDRLKIDGAFIRNLMTDPVDGAMVAAIQNVASVMGLKTVAEFVEDAATAEHLRVLGVGFGQGFGIHRPQPLDELLNPLLSA